ncbi:KR domain-containing protein [Xylariaceae sp. FL1651]|nr:KR domain-containing protein [Xylariaceae sp. FL1651]
MPSIKEIVSGGMALDDSILENMTLDFLIFLSSIIGVIGNPSQANYAAGGAYQDAVARSRAAKGQAYVSIDLGVVERKGELGGAKVRTSAKANVKLYNTIDTAPSVDKAAAAVQQALVDKISDMFVIPEEDIDLRSHWDVTVSTSRWQLSCATGSCRALALR